MKEEVFRHEIDYLSANCNRKPHAFDLRSNLIVYPSCNSICVYDYVNHIHVQLLNGHDAQVNCVRWIKSVDGFVSCSLDGQAIIWTNQDGVYTPAHKCSTAGDGLISVHSVVTTLNCEGFKKNLGVNYFTCASLSNEKVAFWFNDDLINLIDINQFVFDVRLMQSENMFGDAVFIGLVGSDSMVQMMVFDENKNIHKLIKLGGHEDWIQSIDLMAVGLNTLYLATGCQDHYIRVWKISRIASKHAERGHVFEVLSNYFEVSIETILLGHEGWIYSVQFVENSSGKVCLLSASMDKSIVLWSQGEDDDEVWLESIRVGDVGGSSLGFVGALISPDLTTIIGQSFNGALHLWKNNKDTNSWSPETGLGGHWEIINDLSWEPNGYFLLTCSLDQTTRLHAPWVKKDSTKTTWHEIARPQIHGYDLNCIAIIDALTFASGADEKVVRVFSGTKSFAQNAANISGVDLSSQSKINRELPECASVPPLGLSNKAIYSDVDMDEYFKSVIVDKPPLEEVLQQNTLWPEIQKLFGHSYELFTLTCNHERTLIASACKASKSDSANVIIWDISNDFKKRQELYFHSLTITQIRFSPNDRYLISVSRDRTWCLYEVKNLEAHLNISRIAFVDKKTCLHNRIIWDVAWTPDNQYFITCSRDKKAIIWNIDHNSSDNDKTSCLGPVKAVQNHNLILSESIISVDVSMYHDSNGYIIAFGLENGIIQIYRWSIEKNWQLKLTIDNCHTSLVKKLRFRPGDQSSKLITLASCGDDRKVIIHKILID